MKKVLSIIIVLSAAVSAVAQDYIFNRHPLAPTEFAELPIGAIKADGWLHDQLIR